MKLKNIYDNRQKGTKRTYSKKQLLEFFMKEDKVESVTKYSMGDTFIKNGDPDKDLWEIARVIPKVNIEGFIEPQLYVIETKIANSWRVFSKTVTEEQIDKEFTLISEKNEPESNGEEFDECVLKESEEVDIKPVDKAILDMNFFKSGEHYIFWPNSDRPLPFLLERMFIDSGTRNVNCHIMYEDEPGVLRGTKKRDFNGIKETYVTLQGMEDMRKRGDVVNAHYETIEPETDGSEWDE